FAGGFLVRTSEARSGVIQRRLFAAVAVAVTMLFGCSHEAGGPAAPERPLSLIPQPAKIVRAEGSFKLTNDTRIAYEAAAGAPVAERLAELLAGAGLHLSPVAAGDGATGEGLILLKLNAAESAD